MFELNNVHEAHKHELSCPSQQGISGWEMLMYSNREAPIHPDMFSGTVNESALSPREGQFIVSQVCNDSFYLEGFKLGVI